MERGKFLAGETQFDAAQRIGFDQVDKLPQNFAGGEFALQAANGHGRHHTLEQAADGAGKADIDLGNAQFGVAVGALIGEIDIVDPDDFAAVGVDDLLVKEVFADGEPSFIGMVELEGGFVGGEGDAAGNDGGDLVVTSDERAVLAAGNEHACDAVGLVGRLDEYFFDAADVVAQRVECLGADDFGSVQHCQLLTLRRFVMKVPFGGWADLGSNV